jgi:hypothetical protein
MNGRDKSDNREAEFHSHVPISFFKFLGTVIDLALFAGSGHRETDPIWRPSRITIGMTGAQTASAAPLFGRPVDAEVMRHISFRRPAQRRCQRTCP